MSEERGKTMTNVNRIVAENNKVVRYINGNSIILLLMKELESKTDKELI